MPREGRTHNVEKKMDSNIEMMHAELKDIFTLVLKRRSEGIEKITLEMAQFIDGLGKLMEDNPGVEVMICRRLMKITRGEPENITQGLSHLIDDVGKFTREIAAKKYSGFAPKSGSCMLLDGRLPG